MLRSFVVSIMTLLLTTAALAEETVSTFTLDALSFVSFGDEQVVPLPAGSTIKFRFGAPAPDGSTTFTIAPGDVAIAPVPLPDGSGMLEYALGATASGSLQALENGKLLDFTATVRATLVGPAGQGAFDYVMPFSTSGESATSIDGSKTLTRTGVHVIDGVWYAQIVGATTNKGQAFPGPGVAVYTVLSGRFDTIP
jgi:hypothetical protein